MMIGLGLIILKTVYHIYFIYRMLIDFSENTIPDIFKFNGSKVKVTMVKFVKAM